VDGVPNISLRIFYKKASAEICDSLFELIPNISPKIFYKRLQRRICERRSKHFLEYFMRRLQRRSANSAPHISHKIFSQEALPIICDSLFELIPNISPKIFSQEASPIICDSLFELIPNISSKIFSQEPSPIICERCSK